ncbi:MAG: cytochrome c peroxidase [Flavobacterium sp.]|uniref:cytochrome-c peroxidase n=1 Tax=Flavobacterium sp. TaxID=239 RepID=UPI002614A6DB|nr:cytochrome c peroxidase [Flavobacterium sp.]MDD5150834.1 cytochrome c peroxidase [Flavobacterium sp.]
MKSKLFIIVILSIILFTSCSKENEEYTTNDNAKIELGKQIFNDTNLSNPIGQSCASCHSPEKGFSDPENRAVSEGVVSKIFGNRNAPSLAYNIFSPERYYDTTDETFIGGLFLDGRSPNLQKQFIHPMLNPLEMNNTSKTVVAQKIKLASYYPKMVELYTNSPFESDVLSYVADALTKFQTSAEVNLFTSKFDYYLQGRASFTLKEKKGFALFQGKALCSQCHVTEPDSEVKKILFTDFTYDNIGVPKNPNNPFYTQASNSAGINYIDLGIGAIVSKPEHNGKFRVPTLRNIALSGPYFHNGSLKTLEEVVHFYNVRDTKTGEFGTPEVQQNINTEELGNLNLTPEEEQNLVIFMNTLTDGYHK